MQVREVMSAKPDVLPADTTIREAAIHMRDAESGLMPISRGDKLVGMLTDRDIAIRAVAEGKNPDDRVDEILTDKVLYCFENDDVKSVLENMYDQRVQRLIVLKDKDHKDLVGVVTVADIADKCQDDPALAKEIAHCCSHYH